MEKKVLITGISCESCDKVIARVATKSGVRAKSLDLASGEYEFEYDSEDALRETLAKLETMGYSTAGKGSKARRAYHVLRGFLMGEYAVEREMALTTVVAFVLSVGLQLLAFSSLGMRAAFGKYLPFMVFLDASLAAVAFSMWHFFSVRKNVPCETGMMVGMTIGMVLGFLVGFSFGATNGMFVGSVMGMLFGMAVGAWAGSCCGVMGVMEGTMAGLMSGTMGAMLSVMLLSDRVLEFAAVLLASCIFINAGMGYMLFKEFGVVSEAKGHEKVIAAVAGLSLLLAAFALLGPKGPIVFSG